MSISSSYDWVPEIKPELKNLDAIPLTGPFSFPWAELSKRLSALFEREAFVLQGEDTKWRTKEDFYETLGPSPFLLIFSFPSLNGLACWVMPEQDIRFLTTQLFARELPSALQDHAFIDTFYRFLTVEVLFQLKQLLGDQHLHPILTTTQEFPDQEALAIDVSLQLEKERLRGRLLISPILRHSWVNAFIKKHPSSFSHEMAQAIWLSLHIEIGKVQLLPSEWSSIELGDFVILDSCSLNPERNEGKTVLTLNGKPAFRAKLKDSQLKILEFPLLHEVDTPMAKEIKDEDDEFEELNLSSEESFEELEESLFKEEDNQVEERDQELEDSSLDALSSTPSNDLPEEQEKPSTPQIGLVHLEEVPLTIIVEIGQIQMNLDQILKLEPGNLLPLQFSPEQGVQLTVNGKAIAKGELIRIGEVLGVRITQLGHSPISDS